MKVNENKHENEHEHVNEILMQDTMRGCKGNVIVTIWGFIIAVEMDDSGGLKTGKA